MLDESLKRSTFNESTTVKAFFYSTMCGDFRHFATEKKKPIQRFFVKKKTAKVTRV
jgi:hypothetical protein